MLILGRVKEVLLAESLSQLLPLIKKLTLVIWCGKGMIILIDTDRYAYMKVITIYVAEYSRDLKSRSSYRR